MTPLDVVREEVKAWLHEGSATEAPAPDTAAPDSSPLDDVVRALRVAQLLDPEGTKELLRALAVGPLLEVQAAKEAEAKGSSGG